MDMEKEEKDGQVLLKIRGALSIYEAAILREELAACLDQHQGLTIDLKEVSDCDTAGVQLLCSAHKTARNAGKAFALTGAPDAVHETLTRVGLDPGILAL